MSLNRSEQMVCDYVAGNPEELRFWQDKVRAAATGASDLHAAAIELAEALWSYYEERAGVVPAFQEAFRRDGGRRVSLRNLAEYWLHLWVEPKSKRRRPEGF